VRSLDLVRMPLIKTKLTISGRVMGMVFTAFLLLIFHEIEISVQTVEGIFEEESHKAVCPSVRPKKIKNPQFWAAKSYPGQELELEGCFTVQLALDVVLEHKLC